MKLLITLILLSLLVTLFGLLGLHHGAIVLAGILVMGIFVATYVLYRKKHPRVATGTTAGTQQGFGWGWMITVTLIAVLLTWWFMRPQGEGKVSGTPTVATSKANGLPAVQPKEEWVFEWSLPPGQYDRGINNGKHEVRIVKNDSESLWFDIPYTYEGRTEIARFMLTKSGSTATGSWLQDNPRDIGKVYLRMVTSVLLVGQYTDRTGRSMACVLKQK